MSQIEIIRKTLEENGCKIISDIVNQSQPIKYICKCGLEKSQPFKDYKRRNCRNCKNLAFQEEKNNDIKEQEEIDEKTGEIWKRIPGGWISSFGRAKNINGKFLTLCPEKFRYSINGKHEYATRLIAMAFKIEGYDKLDNQSYCVSHIDDNRNNNKLENLKIISKADIGRKNGQKSKQSENFYEKLDMKLDEYIKNNQYVILDFLPNHKIFITGEIYSKNLNRFLTGSLCEKYLRLFIDNKNYYIHRLICFAFHKLPNRNSFDDYKDLQVNHIDGNTLNNSADNLEWSTQSQNMNHAYQTGLNKKARTILQYTKNTNQFIKEYPSIAEASRQSGDKEHQIRSSAQGKDVSTSIYSWKFKNPEDSDEYSKKYSSS